MKSRKRIWLSPPDLTGEELDYVKEAFDQNWVAPAGPHIDQFEMDFARKVGAKHALAVNSGTSALHLALRCLDAKPGAEVLVSDFTFAASVNPVLYENYTPVFIGSDTKTWNIKPAYLEQAIKDRVKQGKKIAAVIVVHVYGIPANLSAITEICSKYSIPIIEDAAESLGSTIQGSWVGTFGRCGIFSFNGNKLITTSAGGMLVTDNEKIYRRSRKLAMQAKNPEQFHLHNEIGFNYRMSNILAGIGRAQLKKLDERIRKKQYILRLYKQELESVAEISFMPLPSGTTIVPWLSCITLDQLKNAVSNHTIIQALEKHNIESRPLWRPMHRQPAFESYPFYGDKNGQQLFERGLCLPSGTSLKKNDIKYISNIIKSAIDTQ